jgi:2,3-bisphosphoglycerate-independent phosphoglycerate mutase
MYSCESFNAIFNAVGIKTNDFIQAIKTQKVSDEFITPIINEDYTGFDENDGIITLNWRADRMRQIVDAMGNPDFQEFKREKYCKNIITIAEYSEEIKKFAPVIFEKQSTNNTFGQIVANAGLKQLRIAETEKYAHVTFFFDCCNKVPLPNYKEILVESPSVATYDLMPEMSAEEVTNQIISEIDNHDVFILNFANLDMVGHTGNIEASVKAVQTIDECVEKIVKEFDERNGVVVITADHGNSEEMFDETSGIMKTSHSLNPVPFCIVTKNRKKFELKNGSLSDIAPTLLHLLELEKPSEMTGENLITS